MASHPAGARPPHLLCQSLRSHRLIRFAYFHFHVEVTVALASSNVFLTTHQAMFLLICLAGLLSAWAAPTGSCSQRPFEIFSHIQQFLRHEGKLPDAGHVPKLQMPAVQCGLLQVFGIMRGVRYGFSTRQLPEFVASRCQLMLFASDSIDDCLTANITSTGDGKGSCACSQCNSGYYPGPSGFCHTCTLHMSAV